MNPPNVYDADGKVYPDRRRAKPLPDDAVTPDVARGVELFVRLMILNKGKVVALFSALAGVAGYMAGCGGRINDLDVMSARVSAVEGDVADLKDGQKLQKYILCVSVPQSAPPEAHRLCEAIIQQGGTK